MDLNNAYFFVNVVKAGSFSEASRQMSVPLSTVSDRVAALEKSLGVSLLTRTTRKLKLTDAGTEFFKKAEVAILILTSARDQISSLQQQPSGLLKITSPMDFASKELAEAMAEYQAKFPNVRIETYLTNRTVDLVAEGFDIAIRGGSLADSTLMAKKIGSDQQILVASKEYLNQHSRLKHPKELKSHSCIGFLSNETVRADGIWPLTSSDGGVSNIRPQFSMSSTSFAVVIELAKAGAGIALVPRNLVKSELLNGKLVQVLPTWTTILNSVHIVYPPLRFPNPKVKEMIPLLERKLKPLVGQ